MNLSTVNIAESYRKYYAVMLVWVFLGYMFLGKGFAYLHLPGPVYIGEITLVFGFLLVMINFPRVLETYLTEGVFSVQLAFVILGVIGTLPFLGQYGIEAIRDSAIYYYSAFMLITYLACKGSWALDAFFKLYSRVAKIYPYWIPATFFIFWFLYDILPSFGGEVPILFYKSGDMVVHLTAAVAFVFLASNELGPRFLNMHKKSTFWYALAFIACFMGVNRGSILSFFSGIFIVTLFYHKRWRLVKIGASLILIFLVSTLFNPKFKVPGYLDREVSSEMVTGLVMSIFTDTGDDRFRSSTKEWRMLWWEKIYDETVHGNFFWSGRGFGPNLADVHGFQTETTKARSELRSPHNFHMNILARMGVPGFVAWLLLQFLLVLRFYNGFRDGRKGQDVLKQILMLWVLVYWAAFMINASVDVYLEGPQGAICFWTVMGAGLAISRKNFRLNLANPDHGRAT